MEDLDDLEYNDIDDDSISSDNGSEEPASDNEKDEENGEINNDSDNDEVSVIQRNHSSKARDVDIKKIILTKDQRKSRPVLTKFELVMAVSRVAHQINSGAKVPEITAGTIISYDTDVFFLAYRSVMATVKRSLDEPDKTPELISKCASIVIQREIGREYIEEWKLHELAYLDALPGDDEIISEARERYYIDPVRISSRR